MIGKTANQTPNGESHQLRAEEIGQACRERKDRSYTTPSAYYASLIISQWGQILFIGFFLHFRKFFGLVIFGSKFLFPVSSSYL